MKHTILRRCLGYLLALVVSLPLMQARAQTDFSHGVDFDGSQAILWFEPHTNTSWVDAHYDAGAGQQNVRMDYNSTSGRIETSFAVESGTPINYSFTYTRDGLAYDSAQYSATVGDGGDDQQAATPTFDPPGGAYAEGQTIAISSTTDGATIHYTTDGSTPTAESPVYGAPLSVFEGTLKAVAVEDGLPVSAVASADYSLTSGDFSHGVTDNSDSATLWFQSAGSSAWVDAHYTVNDGGQQNVRMSYNGSAGRHEQVFSVSADEPLTVDYSFTYETDTGAKDSTTFSYSRDGGDTQVAAPGFSPVGGTYSEAQSVSIASATSGATVYYTLDGSKPTRNANLYSGSIDIDEDTTLRAFAVKDGLSDSIIAGAGYLIDTGSGDGFTTGVSQLGATATVWFRNSYPGSFVDLHHSITQDGNTSAQENVGMSFNDALDRWEYTLETPSSGTLNYSFTYPTDIGNKDSSWFAHQLDGNCELAAPAFSPVGGRYTSTQNVSLSTAESGAAIHYTTDGSAPTTLSPVYPGSPIAVTSAATINAIAVLSDGRESCLGSESYVIEDGSTEVAAPTFSHSGGTYDHIIRVSMLTQTPGAYIHYTTDGSTPTTDSPVFTAPVEVRIDPDYMPDGTVTVKAVAIRDGASSQITEASYTVTQNVKSEWNGYTTFNLVNDTGGEYADDQVYWAIIGKDWDTDQFVHVDSNGNLIPMQLSDNTVEKDGKYYADYFYPLSELSSVTIPAINSARLMISVGEPMYIQVNIEAATGKIAYAGANVDNPTDPNRDVIFDFGEFAIVPKNQRYQGIFINTTRVDHFGFPLQLTVTGLDGFQQTVGEPLSETRDELFAKFVVDTPAEFRGLAEAPYAPWRIMAPAHASFQIKPDGVVGDNAYYLDDYIDQVWDKWRNEDLILKLDNGWPTFTGRVIGDELVFNDGLGQYKIHGQPTTSEVMLGNGLLDDPSGTVIGSDAYHKQLQLQAQVAAAVNRHVAHLQGAYWHSVNYFFPEGSAANWYTKFWHDHALNGLTYGFSYDDIGGYSPSIYTYSPVSVTYTIGQ